MVCDTVAVAAGVGVPLGAEDAEGVAFVVTAGRCGVVERAAALVARAASRFDVTAKTAALTATTTTTTPASRINDLTAT